MLVDLVDLLFPEVRGDINQINCIDYYSIPLTAGPLPASAHEPTVGGAASVPPMIELTLGGCRDLITMR